ncbi:SDR family NAD(P)-dependent oxidoreductase [Curtobacterium sp. L1-20]|uniref:SDR family NAD(P)-dependent oxidoreductase n=1 Tax=Curtobacterium sp. L1-20 TaxID=3138181 RepID=UPI003B52E489
MTLAGKTVMVTGAAGGIGGAIADAFRRAGARLILVDVVAPSTTISGDRWVEGDLRSPDVVRAAVAAATEGTGRLDVLVNAAGVQVRKPSVDLTEDDWQRLVSINVSAAYALSRAAAQPLARTKGSIVNISSSAALVAQPGIVPYGATKAALTQLSKGMAVELGPEGIRVNAVAPGQIRTPMTADKLSDRDVEANLLSRIPLRRIGTAAEVADVVLFLASEQARYVTGTLIPIDGGYAAN